MELFLTITAFSLAFIFVVFAIPPIIRVGKAKHLFDQINERKIHKKIVPPLGGVAIFIGLTLSSMICVYGTEGSQLRYIWAAVIIMFFIGLKDDLLDISAWKKLAVQIFAALLMVTFGDFHFTTLHGVLGIYSIDYIFSVLISVFTIIVIINAFNLIDGVDGLASGLAITSGTLLGIWFLMANQVVFAILSFSLVGSLAGFFIFNVFGNKHKLFMGDTGSLIVGTVIAALIIKFNELNIAPTEAYHVKAAPAVSFAIIIVPLVDTLRVMAIRIKQKRSPFTADTNHIHHRIFYFYKKHIVVTSILVFINLTLFGLALLINETNISVNYQLLIILLTSIVILYIPSVFIKISEMKKKGVIFESRRSLIIRLFF